MSCPILHLIMKAPPRFARVLRRSLLLQLTLMLALWQLGSLVVQVLRLPLPGSIVGLGVLLVLLATRRLPVRSMRRGSQWLIRDMLLFFVPAALAVLEHRELLGLLGLKLLLVIGLSTAAVMRVTAFAVDCCYRATLRETADALPVG
jgi:holin-like protein